MRKSKSYSKIFNNMMWFMVLLLVVFTAGCDRDHGTAGVTTPPTVTLTSPARAVTGVAINRKITATFSTAMDPATINATTFSLIAFGGATIPGTVTLDATNNTATFAPASNLAVDTSYTATITTGAKDLAGTAMAANYNWSFTTGLTADTTAPTVIATAEYGSTGVKSGATGLPINRDSTATFSEAMDPATISAISFLLTGPSGNVPGAVTYIGTTATFNPTNDLAVSATYTSTITTGAKDLAGNPMAVNYVWSWTTGAAADTTAPTVTVTNPADLATNVPLNKTINATFSEAMRQSTMITTNYTLRETVSGNNVPGTVAYDSVNHIVSYLPTDLLTANMNYTATVTSGATDLAGNALVSGAAPNPWTFTTAATIPLPLAINLGAAATFGIASNAGLTSTGVTVVNGDVAIYPTPSCTDATGVPANCLVHTKPPSATGLTVNGSIFWFGDPFDSGATAAAVKLALNTAWVEGKNKVDTQGAIAADQLAGKTFLPGVYHNANLGLAAGGIATMDAQNDANAVFIFKVDSSFTDSGIIGNTTSIVLKNGAQARNIWFIIGLDATIGHGTTWYGNILAGQTVTILDSSTVTGRVLGGAILGGSGAITLTGAASPSVTTITVPQ